VGACALNRRAGGLAVARGLVTCRVQQGAMGGPRVAVGGVEAQPRRIAQAEQALAGRTPDRAAFEAAAAAVASAGDPLEDANTSAAYPRDPARPLTRPPLEQAAARARGCSPATDARRPGVNKGMAANMGAGR